MVVELFLEKAFFAFSKKAGTNSLTPIFLRGHAQIIDYSKRMALTGDILVII
jgi:hypothetical protein